MNEHVLDWIGAYADGELTAERRRRVDHHLAECAACRAELEAVQALTLRLHAAPPMPARTPPEQFTAQVRLRLAHRPAPNHARLRRAAGVWLPLGVLALWALGQAVLAAVGLGLLVWVGTSDPVMLVFGVTQWLALNFALTLVAAGLVWGCLAVWWVARERPQGLGEAGLSETAALG